ncbi:MAG: hypothetical protein ACRDZW_04485 [Acidimicrobiales bacterium]
MRLDGRESVDNARMKVRYGPVVAGNVQNRIVSPSGENLAALPTHVEPGRIAGYLRRWADRYDSGAHDPPPAGPVPYLSSLHQALNVAACDSRPLVVVVAPYGAGCDAADAGLQPLVADAALEGRFHFVRAEPGDAMLARLSAAVDATSPGVYFVGPDEFGLRGRVLALADVDAGPAALGAAARAALDGFERDYQPRTVVEKFQLHSASGEPAWRYPGRLRHPIDLVSVTSDP